VQQTGTALPAGNAPAQPLPTDHAADRVFAPQEMMEARHHLAQHGGQTFSQVLLNIAEYQLHSGRDGYRWDGEAWFGGDINRVWIKSEGEGEFRRGGLDSAEVQALYSRAIGPYFNLQAGLRYDFKPSPSRTYATVGFEGLAPGFFEVEGAAFVSNKGEVLGRLEGYYDQRVTQRLILQPRVEFNLSAQNAPSIGIGSGLVDAEAGLRLRYEVRREFAPYIGVSYLRKAGDTARLARLAGEDVHSTSLVVGIRTWF
jgi:copper resistance protein B